LFDSVLYPNGHVLILNGARWGRSGGAIGLPLTKASATGKTRLKLELSLSLPHWLSSLTHLSSLSRCL
jgi:hypothetical protein